MTESETLQHDNVISKKGKASMATCLPESTAESQSIMSSRSHSEAASSRPLREIEAPLQPETRRGNELSTGLSESVPKHAKTEYDTSNVGIRECCLQPVETVEVDRCSLEHLVGTGEVSKEPVKPALMEAGLPLCFNKRRLEPLAVSKTETSAYPRSLVALVALTPSVPLPAIPSQAKSIGQPSLELSQLVLKLPDDRGIQQLLCEAISTWCDTSVNRRSPESGVVPIPPNREPASLWVRSCCFLHAKGWWWMRYKPLDAVVSAKRRNSSVVSKAIGSSAMKHLPSTEAVFALPVSPSARLLRMSKLPRPSLELAVRVLKPPNKVAYIGFLNKAMVNISSGRKGLLLTVARPRCIRTRRHPCRLLCSSSPWSPDSIASRGCGVLRDLRLLAAVFGQRN